MLVQRVSTLEPESDRTGEMSGMAAGGEDEHQEGKEK